MSLVINMASQNVWFSTNRDLVGCCMYEGTRGTYAHSTWMGLKSLTLVLSVKALQGFFSLHEINFALLSLMSTKVFTPKK